MLYTIHYNNLFCFSGLIFQIENLGLEQQFVKGKMDEFGENLSLFNTEDRLRVGSSSPH